MLGPIFEPFVNKSPVTVMAGAALSRLLSAQRLDAVFEDARQEQYVHQLLFSTTFSLMAAVVTGTRKSIHHAFQTAEEPVGASIVAVYDKLKRIEPSTSQALVRDVAAQVTTVIDELDGALSPVALGYPVRILDGNCIAASHHRIKALRSLAAGALPGKSLAVLDPDRRVIRDVFPCEDGHAQERSLLTQVLATVEPGELWIADRNFCTTTFLQGIHGKGAFFIIRQHGNMTCAALGPLTALGRVESGMVYEQVVRVEMEGGESLTLRRIELHLDEPTRDEETIVALLTNLPAQGPKATDGQSVAELYRPRWRIETAFQELAEHLNSEINALGYPKAALFGFCVAVVIFNAIAMLKAALRGSHGAEKIEAEVSNYYIAAELESTSRGMTIAIPHEHWRPFGVMPIPQFVNVMLMLAAKVNLAHFKKHPRGPKKPKVKPTYDPAHPHVSIAKLLAQRKPPRRVE